MADSQLSAEARQRFEIAGVAQAWLERPLGYPRELRAVLDVLEEDEHVTKVFHVFLGNWLGVSGLLFFTTWRLIYVQRRSFRRRIVSIPFELIQYVRVVQSHRKLDVKVETSQNDVFGFWRATGGREDFMRFLKELENEVGDRFIGAALADE